MKHILLVDGMALLFRGFYATAYNRNFMVNDKGIPTNGVQQFLRYFLNSIETFQPSHVVCCWDVGKTTFRTEMYNQYKANRTDPPEELIPQFSLVQDVVRAFSLPNVGIQNYEADDVIGTLASTYHEDNITIITGDRDILQLVNANTKVALMKKGIGNYDIYHEGNFYEKVGLYPEQLLDFKGLTGDSADNYPGVKGIGEKTALKLLRQYDSFETMLQLIDELTPAMQKRLTEQRDMFYLSRSLAEIKCDVPVTISLEEARYEVDVNDVEEQIHAIGVPFPLRKYV